MGQHCANAVPMVKAPTLPTAYQLLANFSLNIIFLLFFLFILFCCHALSKCDILWQLINISLKKKYTSIMASEPTACQRCATSQRANILF